MKKIEKMRERMTMLQNELQEREQAVEDKKQKDIANYGVPLGNTQLVAKVSTTMRKIVVLEERMIKAKEDKDGQWKLPKYDQRILNAIRGGNTGHHTSAINSYKYDNRYSGSANTRRAARAHHRRVNE